MGVSIEKLKKLLKNNKKNGRGGIYSVCSAHPWVLEASFEYAKKCKSLLLIESTCNQVNHRGGYTGTTPKEFYNKIMKLAESCNFPKENLILGGDHLGPNPWAHLPAKKAMQESEKMVRAYVRAGYTKLHLDTSVACADDEEPLHTEVISKRAAQLCEIAEDELHAINTAVKCIYVIGTEVPRPGGIREHETLHITLPSDVKNVIEITKQAFITRNLKDAWKRVVAIVVQPGVEFGDNTIIRYDNTKTKKLKKYIKNCEESIIYEAHSTDYQDPIALQELVKNHFAILKVGPHLTFAMREALFSLASIEDVLYDMRIIKNTSNFIQIILSYMKSNPTYWEKYYHGTEKEKDFALRFSLSDRIRYYWNAAPVTQAIQSLIKNLHSACIPPALISQYLPYYSIHEPFHPITAIKKNITRVLTHYHNACM